MPFTRMLSLVVPVFAFSFMYFYKKKRIEEGVYANTHKKVCKHSSKSYENLLPRFIIDKTMCLLPLGRKPHRYWYEEYFIVDYG